MELQRVMRIETGKLWQERREHNWRKVGHLFQKWRPKSAHHEPDIKGVQYRDIDLDVSVNDKNDEATIYGGVEVSDDAKSAARLNPKFMTFEKIRRDRMEVEIEKGNTKIRYSLMRKDEDGDDDIDASEPLDLEAGVINYGKVRATNLPTCQRLIDPRPGNANQEASLEGTKEKLMQVVDDYIKEQMDKSKKHVPGNLTQKERRGVKDLKKMVEDRKLVVSKSDKSGVLTLDSVENYIQCLEPHTANDVIIDRKKVTEIEKNLNQHLKVLNDIFNVGIEHDLKRETATNSNQYRVGLASVSTNVEPPDLYGLKKTHKSVPEGQEEAGPAMRPVCGAKEAPNSRLSNFVSMILRDFAEAAGHHNEVKSSEEMRAKFDEFNTTVPEEVRRRCVVMSFDVKSMYPSLRRSVCVAAVRDILSESPLEVEQVDMWALLRYVAITCTPEDIAEEGLTQVVPTRVHKRRVTVNCMVGNDALPPSRNAYEPDKWVWPAAEPTHQQRRRLIAIAVSAAVDTVMRNHTYKLGDTFYLQTEGAPIGLQMSGEIGRICCMVWDRLYKQELTNNNILMPMYGRYVDDGDMTYEVPVPVDDEDGVDAFKDRLLHLANGLMDGIVMEADMPSNYDDKKLPILNMKCWLEDGILYYQHYEKPISSKRLIPYRSAHASNCKRSVHVEAIVTICVNTSRLLSWDDYFVPVLRDYMVRMMQDGYPEDYRRSVLKQGLARYEEKLAAADRGERPLNRPTGYRKVERKREKKLKKRNWFARSGYAAPVVIPATPGSVLLHRMRAVADKEKNPKLRLRICERGGVQISRQLMKSNVTQTGNCGDAKCPVYNEKGCGSICRKSNNINYQYSCQLPPCKPADSEESRSCYHGETSKNIFTRGKQHWENQFNPKKQSFIRDHQQQDHEGAPANFKIKVLSKHPDPMSRVIAEAMNIKNHTDKGLKNLNSKAEYHQAPIVRTSRQVTVGL